MEFVCNSCNREFNSEGSLNQHNSMKHSSIEENKNGKINTRKYFIFALGLLIVVFLSITVYSYMSGPGELDDFAKCLTEKGVVIYGNDFCSYTNHQLGDFGKSSKHLNYVRCIDNEALCDEKGVEITPTWEIDGKTYNGVQPLDKLSTLSGCEI